MKYNCDRLLISRATNLIELDMQLLFSNELYGYLIKTLYRGLYSQLRWRYSMLVTESLNNEVSV
jgi:hypothetical protein